jgi:polysaccharide deacetylase 2 family uncharacterized protein YibQ
VGRRRNVRPTLNAFRFLAAALALGLTASANATHVAGSPDEASNAPVTPTIAIIIDDMGYRRRHGERAIALPGAVTFAVIPSAPYARYFAQVLSDAGKETMIHMPMEPLGHQDPGPGALLTSMAHRSVNEVISHALGVVPNAHGLNNHMGSRATADRHLMQTFMAALSQRVEHDFYFVDSRTTPRTVTRSAAASQGIPYFSRDVFLDNVRSRHAIRRQLNELLRRAMTRGSAIGIGHPYSETLDVLAQELPRIRDSGIRLVPVSQLPRREHVASLLTPR